MRKLFSLIAAVLFAGSMMAESITITAESFKSSYGEGTFTLSEVGFAYTGAMYNGKGSPVSAAAKSFIQLRKSANGAGEIKNNDELSLKTITVATQNDKDFTLSAGTASDALEAVTKPAGVAGKYAFTDKDGAAAECDVTVYTFDVEGKKYFDLLNGAAASYIAYITIELGEGGEVTPPACDWDNIAFLGNGTGDEANTNRFKVCVEGTPAVNVINAQNPDWAAEAGISNTQQSLKGAKYVIAGDIVEFGRKTEGDHQLWGILGHGKSQIAYAKVNINIIDVTTSAVVHSAVGAGEYELSNRDIVGFGSSSSYDSTLNGKVLSLAIREAVNNLTRDIDNHIWKP